MPDLTQLYQDIILGHNKQPRNYGVLSDPCYKANGNNPLCGDEVTVYWKILDDKITALSFEAQGCAISRASASMMTELLKGRSLEEARSLFARFNSFLASSELTDMPEEFGEMVALVGVRRFPSRIKCATLAWHAFLNKKLGQPPEETALG